MRGPATTRLRQAAYDAQLAAALPVSDLARELLTSTAHLISHRRCGAYIHTIQQTDWFAAAFTGFTDPISVRGGRGHSRADAAHRLVKIGGDDRRDVGRCEQACLHELAHIVTADHGPDTDRREPATGQHSSKGHHHAWRANFVFLASQTLGRDAARRLHSEFNLWGLPVRT